MAWIFPIILLIVFEGIADILGKEWTIRNKPIFWVGSITGYVIANVFWLYALKNGSGLTRGAMIFYVGSAIVALLLGTLLYKETLTQIQLIGVLVGVIALALIFWPAA